MFILERPLTLDELSMKEYSILHTEEKRLMKDLGIISISKDS